MPSSADILSALKELSTSKQLERTELVDLLRDGIHAALVKRYGELDTILEESPEPDQEIVRRLSELLELGLIWHGTFPEG